MAKPCCCSWQKASKIVAIISLISSLGLIGEEITILALKGCSNGVNLVRKHYPEYEIVPVPPNPVNPHSTLPPTTIDENHKERYLNSSVDANNRNASLWNTILKDLDIDHDDQNYSIGAIPAIDEIPGNPYDDLCHMTREELVIQAIWILGWFVDAVLAIMLIYGAFKKSIKFCFTWFHIRAALLIFRIIFLIMYALLGLPMLYKIPVILLCLFRIYSLWVVGHFIVDLRREGNSKPKLGA